MIWDTSAYLWLLVLIPLIGIGGVMSYRYKMKLRKQYIDDPIFANLYKGDWKAGRRFKDGFMLLGIAMLIIALAGPKIGTEVREIKRQGIDLMIALDLSSSMNAQDISPSRLEKAKYETMRLVTQLSGDRVGLIVFTGEAFLQSPLTVDYSALRLFLNIADTGQMPSTTTNFDAAFVEAKRAFEGIDAENESDAAQVLLVISDGENFGMDYSQSLRELVDMGVQVYTIGIGTVAGGTIPEYDGQTGRVAGYKRDRDGEVVTTKLESETLQKIADDGNGRYFEIQRGNENFDAFINRIGELQKGEFASQEYADYKNQYQTVALIGLCLIGLAVAIPRYRKPES
jgi:Ca-activated chloride channel family protein